MALPIVAVSEIGEFIRYKSCQRRFKLGFNKRELAKQLPFAGRLFSTLDPALQASGRKRELEWERYLLKSGLQELSPYRERPPKEKSVNWESFSVLLHSVKAGQNLFVRELEVTGELGEFQVLGSIDFVLLYWTEGKAKLRLVECKASRKDQTYHRAQLALYAILVRKLLDTEPGLYVGDQRILPVDLEAVVARIDENTNKIQGIFDIETFDLSMIERDIAHTLSSQGPLIRILREDLDSLPYQIESKCDECIFNIHCLPESARLRKLELTGVNPATVRALQQHGINSIDALAQIDLSTTQAESIQCDPGFSGSLEVLRSKAKARLSSLMQAPEGSYPVRFLSYRLFSQLPEHEIHGQRLIRIYLSVDYDYVENRVAALSAHITASDAYLYTGWQEEDGKKRPDPVLRERIKKTDIETEESNYEERELSGEDLIEIKESAWTGIYNWDTEQEKLLLERFFKSIVEAVKKAAAGRTHAPIHFYVWSRRELSKLIEACSRSDSSLLAHLQELLGCRDSLEQMIYSCLQSEIDNRYGLAWTGRGLLLASSLNWYGWSYHWTRLVEGETTRIDRVMNQDLFDFKTELFIKDNEWLDANDTSAPSHTFELRSQFNDSLPAGYLHAYWGTLNDDESELDSRARQALNNFKAAAKRGVLREYLRARVHALRWLEERVIHKSAAIVKPPIFLSSLPDFSLNVSGPERASIDFLRLDFHIRFTDWLAQHLPPPKERLLSGKTLILRNINARQDLLHAQIDTSSFGLDLADLRLRCNFDTGDFVRLSPCLEDLTVPQTLAQFGRGGITCVIESIDWEQGKICMSSMSLKTADRYRLNSRSFANDTVVFDYATLDENPSDFVAPRVEQRLESKFGKFAYKWLDRSKPEIPPLKPIDEIRLRPLKRLLKDYRGPDESPLAKDQLDAVLKGINSRVQLLQGPPGTGKTTTTAISILARAIARGAKDKIIGVSANTHTAIDTLLERLAKLAPGFSEQAKEKGLELHEPGIFKVESKIREASLNGVQKISANEESWSKLVRAKACGPVIVGGTSSSLLRFAKTYWDFHCDLLVIDEASMMVFPYFLALATLLKESGSIMLAGDHRQLSPILSHDWEREDRPPAVLYQPYASAYDAVRSLSEYCTDAQLNLAALQFTFRLPAEIRALIARLYRLDEVELAGVHKLSKSCKLPLKLEDLWKAETGLFLITHNENRSRQVNEIELRIVQELLDSSRELEQASVAVITPHRAQRAMLRKDLAEHEKTVDLIDTVERLQGGERPNIIFSATVSDPAAIASNVDFILDLNRSNVAFSRAKQRLFVICSEELLNYIPSTLEQYEETILWKSLREFCNEELFRFDLGKYSAKVFRPT